MKENASCDSTMTTESAMDGSSISSSVRSTCSASSLSGTSVYAEQSCVNGVHAAMRYLIAGFLVVAAKIRR
jgi:hypothetical protein